MTDFWNDIPDPAHLSAEGMCNALNAHLSAFLQQDISCKRILRDLLHAADDATLARLSLPAKSMFMSALAQFGEADAEEWALWGRVYAGLAPSAEYESWQKDGIAEFANALVHKAEYANLVEFWPQLSDGEKLASLGMVAGTFAEAFGFPPPRITGISSDIPNMQARYSHADHEIMINVPALSRLHVALFSVIHESTHALQYHLRDSHRKDPASMPAFLAEQAGVIALNSRFYMSAQAGIDLYRAQPLEAQANDVGRITLNVLIATGYLPKPVSQPPKPPSSLTPKPELKP